MHPRSSMGQVAARPQELGEVLKGHDAMRPIGCDDSVYTPGPEFSDRLLRGIAGNAFSVFGIDPVFLTGVSQLGSAVPQHIISSYAKALVISSDSDDEESDSLGDDRSGID